MNDTLKRKQRCEQESKRLGNFVISSKTVYDEILLKFDHIFGKRSRLYKEIDRGEEGGGGTKTIKGMRENKRQQCRSMCDMEIKKTNRVDEERKKR